MQKKRAETTVDSDQKQAEADLQKFTQLMNQLTQTNGTEESCRPEPNNQQDYAVTLLTFEYQEALVKDLVNKMVRPLIDLAKQNIQFNA